MSIRSWIAWFSLVFILVGCQQAKDLVIDSFEGPLNSETVDYGAGKGSSVEVSLSKVLRSCGEQSLKIRYKLRPSSHMWVARGYGLKVKGAGQWEVAPKDIPWKKYNAMGISFYGRNTGAVIAFDVKDAGGEVWRFLLDDDFKGWKEIKCPFANFFVRSDWQPETAQQNEILDFPIMSFQLEPRLPGEGIYYFDCVKLTRVKK